MALDPSKWTTKTQEAVAPPSSRPRPTSNPELTPDHLLVALLRQDDTIVPAVLSRSSAWPR